MKKVILFGASGNLGKEIAKELVQQGFDLTLVVRSEAKAKLLSHITSNYVVTDVCHKPNLEGILADHEIVVSALGKSVSPNDKSKATFREVDYAGNKHILMQATQAGIKKFVYVSAFHSEKYTHLEYFKVHHDFSKLLKESGLDYSIIKPPALFSAFLDMMEMAKKGRLITLGKGDKKTNPIFEGDLAKITVDSIQKHNCMVEAGGETIYTRRQLNELVQAEVAPQKRMHTVPLGLFKIALPMLKWFDKNAYHKFAFFAEVMQHDTIAPQLGQMKFEDYIKRKAQEML